MVNLETNIPTVPIETQAVEAPGEIDHAAALDAAFARLQTAELEDGSKAAIDAARADYDRLRTLGQEPETKTVVLPRVEPRGKQQAFTGAPRRIHVTGGSLAVNGGGHRDQHNYTNLHPVK